MFVHSVSLAVPISGRQTTSALDTRASAATAAAAVPAGASSSTSAVGTARATASVSHSSYLSRDVSDTPRSFDMDRVRDYQRRALQRQGDKVEQLRQAKADLDNKVSDVGCLHVYSCMCSVVMYIVR